MSRVEVYPIVFWKDNVEYGEQRMGAQEWMEVSVVDTVTCIPGPLKWDWSELPHPSFRGVSCWQLTVNTLSGSSPWMEEVARRGSVPLRTAGIRWPINAATKTSIWGRRGLWRAIRAPEFPLASAEVLLQLYHSWTSPSAHSCYFHCSWAVIPRA